MKCNKANKYDAVYSGRIVSQLKMATFLKTNFVVGRIDQNTVRQK